MIDAIKFIYKIWKCYSVSLSIEEVQRRMRPGGWYPAVLLTQQESLLEIIQEDKLQLESMNVSSRVIGDTLHRLLIDSKETDWFSPKQMGDLDVEIHHRRGFLTCPWAAEEFEKCVMGDKWRPTADEFMISNRTFNKHLNGFLLSIHLIREHSFFGGHGTIYRIEPMFIAMLLGLRKKE
jgi:hypothetical protein